MSTQFIEQPTNKKSGTEASSRFLQIIPMAKNQGFWFLIYRSYQLACVPKGAYPAINHRACDGFSRRNSKKKIRQFALPIRAARLLASPLTGMPILCLLRCSPVFDGWLAAFFPFILFKMFFKSFLGVCNGFLFF